MTENSELIKSDVDKHEIYSDRHPFSLSLRINNFENDAAYKKFIKNVEALVRKSNEYKLWRNYITDVLQINECVITHEVQEETTIEIHHHISSLYDVVSAVVNKHIEEHIDFCTFDICREVIELHFQNRIGYVSLVKSLHEKFHNGFLNIPLRMVRGNYQYFIKEYARYLDEDQLAKLQSRLEVSEHNVIWTRDNYQAAIGD